MIVKPTPSPPVNHVPVRAGATRYEAVVGPGLMDQVGELVVGLVRGPRCAIVADENTAGLFAERVLRSLRAATFQPTVITLAPGEASKSIEQLGAVCEELAAGGLDRTSFIVALGGGVSGDLAGFAAAIYFRGISWVQVPTTLLAQVDSSIGGKTAVNLSAGKNLLGAIHQPVLVIADVETLETLPPRELNQGFAEIIKHAIIADESIFKMIEDAALKEASWKLALLIRRNIEVKAAIVACDEHDVSGGRAILNFGHTIGHAIEQASGYGTLLHGEAISLGIVSACEISVRRAGFPEEQRQKVLRALQRFDLPTRLPSHVAREPVLAAVQRDKKFQRGEVRFVVTSRLGTARLTSEIALDDIRAAIGEL